MFSSQGLFHLVECPEGSKCDLLNCFFLHPEPKDGVPASQSLAVQIQRAPDTDIEPPRKRPRKGGDEGEQGLAQEAPRASGSNRASLAYADIPKPVSRPAASFQSALREASPPPLRRDKKSSIQPSAKPEALKGGAAPERASPVSTKASNPAGVRPDDSPILEAKKRKLKPEALAPRMLQKPPAAYQTRLKLITLLFEQVSRLNEQVEASSDEFKAALELSAQEMITQVLDEEEKMARTQQAIYSNVIKLRIMALKRMGLAEWRVEREKQIAKEFPGLALQTKTKEPVKIETGLTAQEKNALLPNLVTSIEGLEKHGYIRTAPTDSDIEAARAGVEAAAGWEHCDRCGSRFQVFPGRRAADGALASGNSCSFHHGRSRRPPRDKKPAAGTAQPEAQYTCCGKELGTPGCTSAATHVFKVSDPKRLALATPFERTTARGSRAKDAVCMDCEMGYTTQGMELVRLTATSWPSGRELVDVLVRPVGEILDLNTRFSGVTAADMANAKPYDAATDADPAASTGPLPIVGSPAEARKLLLEYLTPQTPLIGHALENDLLAARLVHETLVDTVLLYPHPKGLPIRYGLRVLLDKHLNVQIQTAGEKGHDSKEDARAAGDLVRLKVAERWKEMRRVGWTVEKGIFNAPTGEVEQGTALDPHMRA